MNNQNLVNVCDSVSKSNEHGFSQDGKNTSDPFSFLNQIIDEEKREVVDKEKEKDCTFCKHDKVITEGANKICEDCGIILTKEFTYEKEWRYYGNMDTKHCSDPNRCIYRKTEERSIQKEIEKCSINARITEKANEIYDMVTNNKIYRGNTRKGIIFACVYHAYHLANNPQSCDQLIQIFDINQKIALKGLKFVKLNLPMNSEILNVVTDTKQLIREIMSQFNATSIQTDEVIRMYNSIENKSSLLNRSRPQSVASGLVRFYILKRNPTFSNDYFKQKIKLSELTLSRIVKEIEKVYKD